MSQTDFQFRLLQNEIDNATDKVIKQEYKQSFKEYFKSLEPKDYVFWIFFVSMGAITLYLVYVCYTTEQIALYYQNLYEDCHNRSYLFN